MEIRSVTFGELIALPEWEALCAEYTEDGGNPEFGCHRVDTVMYFKLEEAGVLKILAGFDGRRCVGFIGGYLSPQPHFADKPVFAVDALFVDRAHRASGLGLRLISRMKRSAKESGAVGMIFGARIGTKAHKLYSKLFRPMNTLFWKAL